MGFSVQPHALAFDGITTLENDPQVVMAGMMGCTPRMWLVMLCAVEHRPLPPARLQIRGEIHAYVNHGRWIVECPHCKFAVPASKRHPAFYCLRCGNIKNGGDGLRVVFPPDAQLIETILIRRPEKENRNWRPGETPGDLQIENLQHGVKAGLYGMD